MGKFYEIKKIKVVLFRPFVNSVDSFGNSEFFVKQFMYVDGGNIKDIFGEKYIAGLYYNGEMPEFYYNSINYLNSNYFNEKELMSGVISEERLLEIYCIYNSNFISYDDALRQDSVRGTGITDLSRFNFLKKTGGLCKGRSKRRGERK